jgi:hypothetical protein
MQSTVTNLFIGRLYSNNHLKQLNMRTLHNNQITEKANATKGYVWNLKRRYR